MDRSQVLEKKKKRKADNKSTIGFSFRSTSLILISFTLHAFIYCSKVTLPTKGLILQGSWFWWGSAWVRGPLYWINWQDQGGTMHDVRRVLWLVRQMPASSFCMSTPKRALCRFLLQGHVLCWGWNGRISLRVNRALLIYTSRGADPEW